MTGDYAVCLEYLYREAGNLVGSLYFSGMAAKKPEKMPVDWVFIGLQTEKSQGLLIKSFWAFNRKNMCVRGMQNKNDRVSPKVRTTAKLSMGMVILWLFATGCLEEASYPDEPFIFFKSLEPLQNGTDALLVLGFTDGDGDIGLSEADLSAMAAIDSIYMNNVFIEYYELDGEQWVHLPPLVPYYYRVPRISPSGQNPALRGELRIDMLANYNPFTESDSFRYEIQIIDRALNYSNLVVTPSFSKP